MIMGEHVGERKTLETQISLFSWTPYDANFKWTGIRYAEDTNNCVVSAKYVISAVSIQWWRKVREQLLDANFAVILYHVIFIMRTYYNMNFYGFISSIIINVHCVHLSLFSWSLLRLHLFNFSFYLVVWQNLK
jgi:hypothetical protein